MNFRSVKKCNAVVCCGCNVLLPQDIPEILSHEQCLVYSEEENVDKRSHVGVESFINVMYFFGNDSLIRDSQNRIPLIKLKLQDICIICAF